MYKKNREFIDFVFLITLMDKVSRYFRNCFSIYRNILLNGNIVTVIFNRIS